MLQSSSELVWRRSKRGYNGNLQRDGNEQQALTIQFNEQGRVSSFSQIEIALGIFLVHDTAKFVLFLEPSRNTPPRKEYKMSKEKDLFNMKLEKFTGNQDTTDLIQLSERMKKEQEAARELLKRLEAAAELKELEKALYEIDYYIKKGGK